MAMLQMVQGPPPVTRPKPEYFDKSISGRLKWLYLQWELLTSIYMLEPWERHVFNVVAVSTICVLSYVTFVLVPRIATILTSSLE